MNNLQCKKIKPKPHRTVTNTNPKRNQLIRPRINHRNNSPISHSHQHTPQVQFSHSNDLQKEEKKETPSHRGSGPEAHLVLEPHPKLTIQLLKPIHKAQLIHSLDLDRPVVALRILRDLDPHRQISLTTQITSNRRSGRRIAHSQNLQCVARASEPDQPSGRTTGPRHPCLSL